MKTCLRQAAALRAVRAAGRRVGCSAVQQTAEPVLVQVAGCTAGCITRGIASASVARETLRRSAAVHPQSAAPHASFQPFGSLIMRNERCFFLSLNDVRPLICTNGHIS